VPENKDVSIDNNLLFLMGSLCLSDLLAECLVHSSSILPLALLSASSRDSVRGTTAFCVLHMGQVLGVFFFHRLVYVHTSLAVTRWYSVSAGHCSSACPQACHQAIDTETSNRTTAGNVCGDTRCIATSAARSCAASADAALEQTV
jgi:hypothetical protein